MAKSEFDTEVIYKEVAKLLVDLKQGVVLTDAGIIWEEIATESVRDDLIKAGISREQARHIYQVINPTVMAKHNKTKHLFMINGLYDETVPVRYTTELWEVLGRPMIKWYPCAHASLVFFAKSVIKDVIQFIRGSVGSSS